MNKKKFKVYLNTFRKNGNLKYEYNPFHNYLTDVDLYIYDDTYIFPDGLAINLKNGELLINKGTKSNPKWVDKRGITISDNVITTQTQGVDLWARAGSLIDLDTDLLNFDLNHPVDIEVLPSYDGSVNLILNDDKNVPRLINSRFSVREKNTYEIVDRIGENDTNVYNSKTFDKDTSLYFLYEHNPEISFLGFVKGILHVGQYCFYFTYCDSDDNESDYIAETGLIPVFIGDDKNPFSIDGGIKNLTSNKGIYLKLNNLDKSYNYLKVYYIRYFADYGLNRVYECKKIYKKYLIDSGTLYLQITGNEQTEDLDPDILNISRFNPKSILTQALCKNMLFFGNIVKNVDNYKELSDLSLRIIPQLNVIDNFDSLNESYYSNSGDYAYYNSLNIYNKTGYFNLEYYRFGVVYIYLNGTLSNVYNTLGGVLNGKNIELNEDIYNENNGILIRNYIEINDKGWINKDDYKNIQGSNLNSKGVCLLDYSEDYDDRTIFAIKFKVPKKVSKFLLEELNIKGLFFVRQKCIPNIIALCYLLRMDEMIEAPVLEVNENSEKKYYTECFLTQSKSNDEGRLISNDYKPRIYEYIDSDGIDKSLSDISYAGICPDFLLNLPYYNQVFNSGKFRILKVSKNNDYLEQDGRFYNEKQGTIYTTSNGFKKVTICSVTEDVPTVAIKDKIYRLEVGKTEEAYRFKYAEIDKGSYNAGDEDFDEIDKATNLVRGKYSPYLAIYSESGKLETGCLYNIYQDTPINTNLDFLNRMDSYEPFYAISNRYNIVLEDMEYICWRGDCYINLFTYRLVRNFNDPSLPNNDVIVDKKTWLDHYRSSDPPEWKNISRSDVNAVLLGSWITFRVRSAMNYALRSVDNSYVSERELMGTPRSFYPKSNLLFKGENKLPDSYLYNDAYRASLGYKCYFTLHDINYIKDTFSNRIQYSAIAVLDSYKNNYRYSLSTYYRDYSQEYGSIQRLIGFEGYLLVIFEHGIGVAVVNERILAGNGDGEPVFINTKNVLPEELTIITDTYGTQWGESVVKSEAGYVYGVDTIAKKIWRVKGLQIEILSDFKVNKFLIDNISLSETELYPTIGLKNVKTHYNNNKKDIMFTFYDDVYKDEEKVWNLCYNELLGLFITFYSWIPSYSANIDTKFFTFDRNTSKELTLLSKCNYAIPENSGVLLDTPIVKYNNDEFSLPFIRYISLTKDNIVNYTVFDIETGTTTLKLETIDGSLLNEKLYEITNMKFRIETDHWGNNKLFDIITDNGQLKLSIKQGINDDTIIDAFNKQKVILLYITPYLEKINQIVANTNVSTLFKTEIVAFTLSDIINNPLLTNEDRNKPALTTDFYLHGLAGIFNVVENLYPTYWYGLFHPFEFEFIVNDKIGQLKIFENLILISNKAEPESFHFEIEGDNYEFSPDKRTMYFRLEATKELYQNLGSNILFNRYYTDVAANNYTYEQYYRTLNNLKLISDEEESFRKSYNYNGRNINDKYIGTDKIYPIYSHGLVKQVKSTIFPQYYERIDTFNDVYYKYLLMHNETGIYDFQNLSGSEISWNRDLNLFNIITHVKNSPIDYVGRLRGNSRYKEGKWNVLIPSIIFTQKNEDWETITLGLKFFILDLSKLCNLTELLGLNDNSGIVTKEFISSLPPIVINSLYIPKDLGTNKVSSDKLPNIYSKYGYNIGAIQVDGWTYRKETRIRDKWIKIRVRYSGKNLAVIHSLITLYNVSYS